MLTGAVRAHRPYLPRTADVRAVGDGAAVGRVGRAEVKPGALGELFLAFAVGKDAEDVGAVGAADAESDPTVVLSRVTRRDGRQDEPRQGRSESDRQQE